MSTGARLQPTLRRMAFAHAATRTVVGIGLLVSPTAARAWVGPSADEGGGRVALQAFAIRDALIGLGQLQSLRKGYRVRHWFQLALAFELTDALATIRQRRHLPDGPLPDAVALFALSGIIGGAAVGFGLDE
ncbi:MAG: hypothetical protein ACJ739_07595 [Acidimicrobiales bacterium]